MTDNEKLQELRKLSTFFRNLYDQRFGKTGFVISPDSNLGQRLSDHPDFARWQELYSWDVCRCQRRFGSY